MQFILILLNAKNKTKIAFNLNPSTILYLFTETKSITFCKHPY